PPLPPTLFPYTTLFRSSQLVRPSLNTFLHVYVVLWEAPSPHALKQGAICLSLFHKMEHSRSSQVFLSLLSLLHITHASLPLTTYVKHVVVAQYNIMSDTLFA